MSVVDVRLTVDSTVAGSCSGSPTRTSLLQPYCSGTRHSSSVHWVAYVKEIFNNIKAIMQWSEIITDKHDRFALQHLKHTEEARMHKTLCPIWQNHWIIHLWHPKQWSVVIHYSCLIYVVSISVDTATSISVYLPNSHQPNSCYILNSLIIPNYEYLYQFLHWPYGRNHLIC